MFDRLLTTPLRNRFFEDYSVGTGCVCGPVSASDAEIQDFAKRFDPQWIHTDALAAEAGPFGGIIASGWHTAGLAMRMMVLHYLNPDASLGGLGVDELRWPAPVRPGDELTVSFVVIEARPSRRPGRGIIKTRIRVRNHDEQDVLTMTAISLIATRDPQSPETRR